MELKVELHPKQLEIYNSDARFKVVAAGRRFGKSRLAAWTLIIAGLKSQSKDVFYVAPTFQQAKDILWELLKEIGHDVIESAHENTAVIKLINGRRIYLKGSDRPDTMRGVGLAYVVVDEYADMKPMVWEQILRPALADVKGGALFIGTPKGRNHFYEMYCSALEEESKGWKAFHFTSYDNPLLDPEEINAAKESLSSYAFRQEFLASFEAGGSEIFKEEWLKYGDKLAKDVQYDCYIAVDLAGFEAVSSQQSNKKKRLDSTAIAIVYVHRDGWWVEKILYGRWDIKEAASKILGAAKDFEAKIIGIEKGALHNAVMPYLTDMMKANSFYPRIEPLTHGNRKKTDRIVWGLQGRFEHGSITLKTGDWNKEFSDQYNQFPSPLVHDDLMDALAYIDQIAITPYFDDFESEDFEALDPISGY